MPSRINIGPEGGPFVAVNENSNDLELQDINGNVIAKWDETAGHWDFANNSLTNLAAIETGEADITNETFIRATRSNDSSSTSSGTFINAFDGESEDVRGEFNSNQQFSPDKDGEYTIQASVDFDGNSVEGDDVQIVVRNVTDGANETPLLYQQLGGLLSKAVLASYTYDLSSSKTYEIQARNADSSFVISPAQTEAVIKRSVVQ